MKAINKKKLFINAEVMCILAQLSLIYPGHKAESKIFKESFIIVLLL